MNKIIICRHCNQPEYWDEMRYLNGKCECRSCYKSDYEHTYGNQYIWNDLDGNRPTLEEFNAQ